MIAHSVIKTFRSGSSVRRWHTRRVHREETVGEHTANVLALVFALSVTNPSAALIAATLQHDIAEQWTGDVPATAKWDSPELKTALDELEDRKLMEHCMSPLSVQLTKKEKLVLKWADMLDLCYYCAGELDMGNSTMKEVFDRGIDFLKTLEPHPIGLQLVEALLKDRK